MVLLLTFLHQGLLDRGAGGVLVLLMGASCVWQGEVGLRVGDLMLVRRRLVDRIRLAVRSLQIQFLEQAVPPTRLGGFDAFVESLRL